ncbi:MAG: SpoIIE family protein phosphatase [Bacteroidetes bacterium]|nr:SpoIIE family protein phosphatase [Bacteroidota bacterium]
MDNSLLLILKALFVVALIAAAAGLIILFYSKKLGKARRDLARLSDEIRTLNDVLEQVRSESAKMMEKYETIYKEQETLNLEKEKIATKNRKIWQMSETVYKEKKKIEEQNAKLEEEKTKFKEKNQKLWKQSLAIHKEKERIEIIKKEIEVKHKNITDSINYARMIQSAILPAASNLGRYVNDFFILFKPRDIVSGDFYWFTETNGKVILAVADCTGHGVPGAFMSMLGIAFLNEIVNKEKNTDPAGILEILRDNVITSLKQKSISELDIQSILSINLTEDPGEEDQSGNDLPAGPADGNTNKTDFISDGYVVKDGMDIAICSIDTQSLEVRYAGANNPLYIVNTHGRVYLHNNPDPPTQITEIKPDKQPIAIHPNMKPFANHEVLLQPDSSLYLFTDGFADQFGGPCDKKFKYKPFKDLLLENSHLTMAEQQKTLEEAFSEWTGHECPDTGKPYDQVDDVTVLGIRI